MYLLISFFFAVLQGLGLFAKRDLEKHTMVIEYIGELIRNEVCEKRETFYESQVCIIPSIRHKVFNH